MLILVEGNHENIAEKFKDYKVYTYDQYMEYINLLIHYQCIVIDLIDPIRLIEVVRLIDPDLTILLVFVDTTITSKYYEHPSIIEFQEELGMQLNDLFIKRYLEEVENVKVVY